MIRTLLVVFLSVLAGTCSAASLKNLNLMLKVDSIGFEDISIYEDSDAWGREPPLAKFSFLNAEDDIWGITKRFELFQASSEIRFKATFDESDSDVVRCKLGRLSCAYAMGSLRSDSFSMGDGAGAVSFGDFYMDGGTNVGDSITLLTSEGSSDYDYLANGNFAVWNVYAHNFTVTANNTRINPVPLPASSLFLIAGLGGFGVLRFRARKSV